MATEKGSREADGWSRSLLDADDSSDDDASARSPSRSKLHPQRTRTVSSELEGFVWGAGLDHVDIGLVDEPADLKFVETPFTLARRTAARSKQSTSTSPSASKAQKPTSDEVEPPTPSPVRNRPASSAHTSSSVQKTIRAEKSAALPPVTPASMLARQSAYETVTPRLRKDGRDLPSSPLPSVSKTPNRKPASQTPSSSISASSAVHSLSHAASSPSQRLTTSAAALTKILPLSVPSLTPQKRSIRPQDSTPASFAASSSSVSSSARPAGPSSAPLTAASSPPPSAAPASKTHAPSPLQIRLDSSSPEPDLPCFQAPLVRPQPVKSFVSSTLVSVQPPVVVDSTSCRPPPALSSQATAASSSSRNSLQSSFSRLERFRHIGAFSSTAPPPDSSPLRASALPVAEQGASFSPIASTPAPSAPSSPARGALGSSSTFRLPGLSAAQSLPSTSRLAFKPAESLSAFRARLAARDAAPASPNAKRVRPRSGDDEEGERPERIVLGAAVRSVRPVELGATGVAGAGRASSGAGARRGRGRGARGRGAVAVVTTPRRRVGKDGDEEGESAEARLRRLYRSLDG
ncbi:uncharacterized protein JCM10292_005239 [Rhodotorula paludigena]|uniref:uncharacterized protein n=1 Tax=Rhodotorula paludigena TaxID=86838 RepID=UPI003181C49E